MYESDDQATLGTILMKLFPKRILIRKYPPGHTGSSTTSRWLFHLILEVDHTLLLVWVKCASGTLGGLLEQALGSCSGL